MYDNTQYNNPSQSLATPQLLLQPLQPLPFVGTLRPAVLTPLHHQPHALQPHS
jgi:hypothetical protein